MGKKRLYLSILILLILTASALGLILKYGFVPKSNVKEKKENRTEEKKHEKYLLLDCQLKGCKENHPNYFNDKDISNLMDEKVCYKKKIIAERPDTSIPECHLKFLDKNRKFSRIFQSHVSKDFFKLILKNFLKIKKIVKKRRGLLNRVEELKEKLRQIDYEEKLKIIFDLKESKSFEILRTGLWRSDSSFRFFCLFAINRIRAKSFLDDLIVSLKDIDFKVRAEAVRGLKFFKDSSVERLLLESLKDKDKIVQKEALCSLGELKVKEAARAILKGKFLENREEDIRIEAAYALGKIGDKDAVTPLIKALKKEKVWIVQHAIFHALGWIGDKRAVPHLKRALNDRDLKARRHAVTALGNVGVSECVPLLLDKLKSSKDFIVRYEAAVALGKIGGEKIEPELLKYMKADSVMTRLGAIVGLYILEKENFLKKVYDIIKSKNMKTKEEFYVRIHAIILLGEIGDKKSIPFLISILDLKKPILTKNAIDALRKLTSKNFGYDTRGIECENRQAIERWRKVNIGD